MKKIKLVKYNGVTFVVRKAHCAECDKAFTAKLVPELALTMSDCLMLCREHLWEDMGVPQEAEMMFREMR